MVTLGNTFTNLTVVCAIQIDKLHSTLNVKLTKHYPYYYDWSVYDGNLFYTDSFWSFSLARANTGVYILFFA